MQIRVVLAVIDEQWLCLGGVYDSEVFLVDQMQLFAVLFDAPNRVSSVATCATHVEILVDHASLAQFGATRRIQVDHVEFVYARDLVRF